MPAKGKKVAARQSQINKRKKRQPKKLAVGQTTVAETSTATEDIIESAPRVRTPRSAGRFVNSGPSAYTYMGSELIRIGIFSVPIIVALGVIAWLL